VLIYADFRSGKDVPRRWRWLFGFAHRRSLARADWVAAWRPKALGAVRSAGVVPERLLVMPSAVPVPEQVPSQEDARRRLQLPLDVPIILSVSRLSKLRTGKPWKTEWMLDLLLSVARAPLPADALFVLVGGGRGRPRVEEEVVALRLADRVRVAGSASREELLWFYAACDFFAYAPLTDRVFLALLEAQAAGRPVVTLRSRSAELIVDDGKTGLLADDPAGLEARLAELASDRERCARMGQAAREYVAANHSLETRVRQIEELLVGPPSGGVVAGGSAGAEPGSL
jgi:glycosyltransferase involved in cell wall biosynthesis